MHTYYAITIWILLLYNYFQPKIFGILQVYFDKNICCLKNRHISRSKTAKLFAVYLKQDFCKSFWLPQLFFIFLSIFASFITVENMVPMGCLTFRKIGHKLKWTSRLYSLVPLFQSAFGFKIKKQWREGFCTWTQMPTVGRPWHTFVSHMRRKLKVLYKYILLIAY